MSPSIGKRYFTNQNAVAVTANINEVLTKYFRSSRWRCSVKKGAIKNFTGKHLYWSLFLLNLLAWRPVTLSKRDSNTVVFLWNVLNFKNNYPSRILYFNECIWVFQLFYFEQCIPGITSWAMHFHYRWTNWQGKKQFSTISSTTWPQNLLLQIKSPTSK